MLLCPLQSADPIHARMAYSSNGLIWVKYRVISGSLVRHLYKNDGTIAISPIVISYIGADVGFMSSMHVFGGRFMYPKFLGVIVIIMYALVILCYLVFWPYPGSFCIS